MNPAAPRLYLLAGEVSGDAHAAAAVAALKARHPGLELLGAGGPKLKALAGGDFLDWSGEAVVGLWDVLRKYPYFRRRFRETLREIERVRPDAVVFVDYPGFNLRVAEALRARGYRGKLIYYISPQVWAWNRGRIPRMARTLDLMLCIFPFEQPLFEAHGLRARFVGHPLASAESVGEEGRDPALVALLPGSREREVRHNFPAMLAAADRMRASRPGLRFAAAAASAHTAGMMRALAGSEARCAVREGGAGDLMRRAGYGMVASGTATLEAALAGLPFVIVYRVAWLTWEIGRRLVRVPWIGMPNLLAEREIVPEFLQGNATADALAETAGRLVDDPAARAAQREAFAEIRGKLGSGDPAVLAAEAIAEELFGGGGLPAGGGAR